MHLWTEYEGNTLAGYLLGRLHRSEGRSAFFLTGDAEGHSAILRLTESHFDEGELLGRWQKSAAVSHPNLQAIKSFGRVTFDEVPLVYCLLEPTDADLSEVLQERALSIEETRQVAESVAGALAALHAADLVHEHVEAANIFAVGETVKLRSDCTRECTGDFEADTPEAREALRQNDVQKLAHLLLRCLGRDEQDSTPKPLPSPFGAIIPQMLDGKLSAEGVVAALKPAVPPVPAQPAYVAAKTVPDAKPAAQPPVASPAATYPAPAMVSAAEGSLLSRPVYAGMPKKSARPAYGAVAAAASASPGLDDSSVSLRHATRLDAGTAPAHEGVLQKLNLVEAGSLSRTGWIASACVAVGLAAVLWNTAGSTRHAPPPASSAIAESASPKPQAATPPVAGVQRPAKPSAIPERQAAQASLLASGVQAGWHVIAYTYNYERQAQSKVEHIKRRYNGLQPQVFSPTGHAPYFVALGGSSDAARAMALRDRARQVGLPRDTYARNF
ncbi:MAG: hypothetical protein ACRYGF_07435 [Janthinobacterium lividum]